jgi:enoyl-CoA hydratase/carnithine racemase
MIAISTDGSCATITVDDFTPLTRHDVNATEELRDVIVETSDDDDIKVIVLRSSAAEFCVPTASPSATSNDVWTNWNQAFAQASALYQSICFSKKITITEVTGRCAGAGSLLVLCSDLTVATEDAVFYQPFDLLPESNFALASLSMRLNRAKAWMFRDSELTAEQAEETGLINYVVSHGELAPTTRRLASRASLMPLDGITMSKMMLQAVLDGHGVGREFDMAGFYASALYRDDTPRKND